jgi:glutathione reductase (NADPH)
MKDYDLVVLGTGGAGYRVAMSCKGAGWSVAVINDGLFGGTCSVRGCIPKKVLAGTAEVVDVNRRLHNLGIIEKQPDFNWGELVKLKRSFTDPVPPGTEKALRGAGIDLYTGAPKFIGDLELEVNGEQIKGKKIHIAVGAKPAKLPIDGSEHLKTSDDFLELNSLPKRVLFVGGGYVSFELAHVAARFGADVTILHNSDRPLPIFDQDIVNTLIAATDEVGIKIILNSGAQKIEKHGEVFVVTSPDGQAYEADLVIHGAGRPPAIADLNLEATGVEYDLRRGVLVNEYLQSTSNPNVYAGGDAAASGPPLSPVASRHGNIVAANLLGEPTKQPSYASTPSVIFTTPAVGKVGLLESEAKEKGLEFDLITNDLSDWFDSKRFNLKYAMSKILVEKDSKKIIGAHLIGNHVEDLINFFSLAIELGLSTDKLNAPIFAFPTASDDMRSMF